MYYVKGRGDQIGASIELRQNFGFTPNSPASEHITLRPKKSLSGFVIRCLDVAISIVALLFFSPVLVVVALIVKLQDGGSFFYSQRRIGVDGREFSCHKFRSMLVDSQARLEQLLTTDAKARAEWARDHKLKQDPRITGFGRFIRKTSLDEFPQLFNVIKGEMSLVGPRPIVRDEVKKYGRTFAIYASVKPGITGLWQVSGRNNISYARRVAMDRFFARRRTVGFYLYILVMTVPAILVQRGSY
jgi:lipopolysaccharide/colanic/teichoic acid biosynthesis glycosyltransferase